MCVRGSSPLARGTHNGANSKWAKFRLIPARAGNTNHGVGSSRGYSAHPRSRGEHSTSVAIGAQFLGSSPLARGTLSINKAGGAVLRLIPARAGNTKRRPLAGNRKPAHPRSRGEHIFQRSLAAGHSGSSPLARGTPLRTSPEMQALRLIPARAGNTSARWCSRSPTPAHPRSRGEHPLTPN